MKATQTFHYPDRAKMRPLAAVLAAALLGGCAMLDSNTGSSGAAASGMQIRPSPLVARNAKSPDAYYALGKYYFYQGRFEQAREAFWDAAQLDQGHVDAWNGLGVAYDKLGQYEAAHKAYEAALLKDPQAAHVWANLGYSLILAGRSAESVAPLQKAIALDPANATASQLLASIISPVAVPSSEQAQIPPAVQPEAVASAPQPGPIASVVTAKGTAPAGQAISMAVTANTPPQAAPVVQAPGIPAKPAQSDGGTARREIAAVPTTLQGAVGQPVARGSDRQAMPAAKLIPVASRSETGATGMLDGLRIEVSNGNGVAGMARAVGSEMRESGLKIARITNARPFNKPQTLIVCRPELKSAAMELAQAMPSAPRIVLRDVAHRRVDVRVVLGADSALALKDGDRGKYLVASLGR